MDYENMARDHFFSSLFSGYFYYNEDAIRTDAREINIEFPHSKFMLASVKIEDWGQPFRSDGDEVSMEDMGDLFFILRNVFSETFTFPGFVSHGARYQDKFVSIINSDFPEGWQGELRSKTENAQSILDEQFDLDVTIAFSRMGESLMEVSNLYKDSEDVHDYIQMINEDFQAVFYEDLTHAIIPQSELNYIEMQNALKSCIRRFDTDGARLVTSELITKEFYKAPPTIKVFRFRVYGLVNALLYIMEELRSVMGDEEYEKMGVGPKLTEVESLSEILAEVENIYNQLDEYNKRHENDKRPKWVARIKKYVDDNFTDVNVTVSSAANRFDMTPSYCTRAFKRYIGVSLFDYIQQRRIEAAKLLLADNMSLSRVAEQSGFSSALTMNRAFKRYEGVSPGKFKGA